MTTPNSLNLPKYTEQSPEVAERFARIDERPVVMSVEGLGKVFPSAQGEVTALEDVSFKVRRREFISVIGPSGCGKSKIGRASCRERVCLYV